MAASETTGLLAGSAAGATPSSREAAKDQYVVRAVEHLHVILYVVAWTAVAVFVVLFVNEFVDHAVPVWAVFLVVWVGHVGVLVVAGSSVHLVLESMSTGDSGSGHNHDGDDERTTAQWHQINERRIPLVQYLMYNLAWVLWVSLILVVFEVLLYVGLTGDTPLTACLVPVYVAGGLAVFTAVLCRSAALSVTVTWLLLLATAILVNVKLDDPDRLTWSDTVIPSYALVAYWLLLCLYTLVLHAVDVYRLKTYQLEIVTLYIAALGLFLVAIVGVDGYLGGAQDAPVPGGLAVVYAALLVGSVFLFIALALHVHASVAAMVERMGAAKPKQFVPPSDVGGGWAVAETAFYDSSLLVGDIDINVKHQRSINERDASPPQQQSCSRAVFDVLFCHVLGVPRAESTDGTPHRYEGSDA